MKFKTILLTLILFSQVLGKDEPTTREIFNNLQRANQKTVPPHFSATLSSKLVTAQIKRIPKNKINFNKKPIVKFVFKEGYGFRIVIEHVDDYYKNMFALYEEDLVRSGLYLATGDKNTYSKFIGSYKLYWLKKSKDFPYRLKIIEKDALPGDYSVFYVKENWQIKKSDYYEDNKKIAELIYHYFALSNYTVISKLTLKIFKKKAINKVEFNFEDYDFSKNSIKGLMD